MSKDKGVTFRKDTIVSIAIFCTILIIAGTVYLYNSDLSSSNPSRITGNVIGQAQKENCKEVRVPYDVTEDYIEKEPYQGFEDVQVDLKYEHNGYHRESYSDFLNTGVRDKGIVNIKNVDSETGYFTVKMYFTTLEDGTKAEQTSGYAQPSETKEFSAYYDIDSGEDVEWRYEVIPGKKIVTKPVTKYRDVTKTRTVTKYRRERVCD